MRSYFSAALIAAAVLGGLPWPAASAGAGQSPPPARDCTPPPAALEQPGPDPVAQAMRHYMRGRVMMSSQEAVLAVEEFRQAAALQPQIARIWLNLGLAQYESGNVRSAIESLDKALKIDPADPPTLYFRARMALTQGDTSTGKDLLDRLLATARKGTPYHLLGLYHAGRLAQETGNIDAAVRHYETLLGLLADPQGFFQRYPELYLVYRSQVQLRETLARLLLQQGSGEKAAQVLDEALAERPNNPELLGLMCSAAIQKKDFAAAKQWARKLIGAHPDGPVGYQRLAEAYKAEGKANDVIPELERYLQQTPGNRLLAFQLAGAYEAAGRKDDAAALFRKLSERADKTPGTSVAAALRGAEILIQEGKFVEAIDTLASTMTGETIETAVLVRAAQLIDSLKDPQEVFRQAQRLVTDDVRAYGPFVLVGMLAEVCKQPDAAIALYDKAIARQPKAAIAYSRKADLLIDANRHEDALATYRSAISAGLGLPVFHRKLGMILEHLGRLDEALAEYRLTRQAAPDDKPTRYLLAGALARKGQLDEAARELQSLLARWPGEFQGWCQLAAVSLAKGDLEGAEQAVNQALPLDAASAVPKALLGEIRFRQKRFADAETLAREVLAGHPEDHEVRLLLAYALAAQKRFNDAAAEMRVLLAADPENITWRYLLAGFCTEMGDTAAAEAELLRILQKKPDHAPSNNDLGYLWADRGVNLERAEEMIRRALRAEPQSPAYLDSLGWVMYKTGRFDEAIKMLEEATRLAPDLDATLWDHLGDAYWQRNRRDDALKAWQTAARILDARGSEAKPDDVSRVRRKVSQFQAGDVPAVAPVAPRDPGDKEASKP